MRYSKLTLLPKVLGTIATTMLNFSVRNGKRCFHGVESPRHNIRVRSFRCGVKNAGSRSKLCSLPEGRGVPLSYIHNPLSSLQDFYRYFNVHMVFRKPQSVKHVTSEKNFSRYTLRATRFTSRFHGAGLIEPSLLATLAATEPKIFDL